MPPNFFATAKSKDSPDFAVTETKKHNQIILECKGGVGWRLFLPYGRTDLLCCDRFAVDFYSFTCRASHIGP